MFATAFLSFIAIFVYSSLALGVSANANAALEERTEHISVTQCETVKLYWGKGVHPYNVTIHDVTSGYVKTYKTNHTHYTWVVDLPTVSTAVVNVTDATGAFTGIGPFDILPSANPTCLTTDTSPAVDAVKAAVSSASTHTKTHTGTRAHHTHTGTAPHGPHETHGASKRQFEAGPWFDESRRSEAEADSSERRQFDSDPWRRAKDSAEPSRRRSRMHAMHRKRDVALHNM